MKLIQRFLVWRECRRLRIALRAGPSARAFADLVQAHIRVEQWELALRAAERGIEVFPGVHELEQLRAHARGSHLESAVRRARAVVNKRPSPAAYQALAELHMVRDVLLGRLDESDCHWLIGGACC